MGRDLSLDDYIYMDKNGVRYGKILQLDVYAHLTPDGIPRVATGCIGPNYGWQIIPPEQQTLEDRIFLEKVRQRLFA